MGSVTASTFERLFRVERGVTLTAGSESGPRTGTYNQEDTESAESGPPFLPDASYKCVSTHDNRGPLEVPASLVASDFASALSGT